MILFNHLENPMREEMGAWQRHLAGGLVSWGCGGSRGGNSGCHLKWSRPASQKRRCLNWVWKHALHSISRKKRVNRSFGARQRGGEENRDPTSIHFPGWSLYLFPRSLWASWGDLNLFLKGHPTLNTMNLEVPSGQSMGEEILSRVGATTSSTWEPWH